MHSCIALRRAAASGEPSLSRTGARSLSGAHTHAQKDCSPEEIGDEDPVSGKQINKKFERFGGREVLI